MKTRIIQTRFWDDDVVQSVSKEARYLWVFLLTNKELGMTNYVRIPDTFLSFYTGLVSNELQQAKTELQSTGRILFYKDWIFIKNLERENKYKNSPKLEKPYNEELAHIPSEVIAIFGKMDNNIDSTIYTTIDTTIDSLIKPKTINKKQKIKNHKPKIQEENLELREIVDYYNEVFCKSIQSISGFVSNYKYWSTVHDTEKIKKAIDNARLDKFWRDKMTLAILFRKKNPRGEDVDYIEELSNREVDMFGGGNIAII